MNAEPNLSQTLLQWEQTLQEIEAAVVAADWGAARKLLDRNDGLFDRARLWLGTQQVGGPTASNADLDAALRRTATALARVAAGMEKWQEATRAKLQDRRRARLAAGAYNPSTRPGAQFLRVDAKGTPADSEAAPRRGGA